MSKLVMVCQECGDRTPDAIWKNGVVLCPECEGIEEGRAGKPLARTWAEFQGNGRKLRRKLERE